MTGLDAIVRVTHLLGVILWLGGIAAAAFVAATATESTSQQIAAAARRAVLRVATPGLVFAWGAGLFTLFRYWSSLYAKAGWMHSKITLALILAGLTGVITGKLRRAAASQAAVLSPGKWSALGWAVVVLTVATLVLVVFRPF